VHHHPESLVILGGDGRRKSAVFHDPDRIRANPLARPAKSLLKAPRPMSRPP
jgi:hypothetical protein